MKPINLKPWEVRAIQAGATLLVRPIMPQPPEGGPDAWDRNDWVAVCEFVKQETA